MNDNGINELIKNIKKDNEASKETVNDFIEKNLTPAQANAIQNVLKNPQLIKNILSSPKAKQLLERLGNEQAQE